MKFASWNTIQSKGGDFPKGYSTYFEMQAEEGFEGEQREFEDGIKLWGRTCEHVKHLEEGRKAGEESDQAGSARKKWNKKEK